MKTKNFLLVAACLLFLPVITSCENTTSSNEEIQEDIREDLDRQQEESAQEFREQQALLEECDRIVNLNLRSDCRTDVFLR